MSYQIIVRAYDGSTTIHDFSQEGPAVAAFWQFGEAVINGRNAKVALWQGSKFLGSVDGLLSPNDAVAGLPWMEELSTIAARSLNEPLFEGALPA